VPVNNDTVKAHPDQQPVAATSRSNRQIERCGTTKNSFDSSPKTATMLLRHVAGVDGLNTMHSVNVDA